LAYANGLATPFTSFDDTEYILEHPAVVRPSRETLTGTFSPAFATSAIYQPLAPWLFIGDYALWQDRSVPYHLINLLLYEGLVALLYRWLSRALGDRRHALWAAWLFALHPVHVGTVTHIVDRNYLVSSMLCLLALHGCGPYWVGSLVLFPLALLMRPSVASFPLLILLYDRLVRNLSWGAAFKRAVPFGIGSLLAAGVNLYAASSHGLLRPESLGWAGALAVFARYGWLLGYPSGFRQLYPILERDFSNPLPWAGLLLVAGCAGTLFCKRISGTSKFFLLWPWVVILPVANLFPMPVAMAERYLFFPSVGFSVLCAGGLVMLARKVPSRLAGRGAALVPLLYGVGVVGRNGVWENPVRLYADSVRKSPRSEYMHNYLGNAYRQEKALRQAVRAFDAAIALYPNYPIAYVNRGRAHSSLGEWERAWSDYTEALGLSPGESGAHLGRGDVAAHLQQWEQAIAEYDRAIALAPGRASFYNNRAVAYRGKGDLERALQDLDHALRIDPGYRTARANRALMHRELQEARGSSGDRIPISPSPLGPRLLRP
jgi:tetratricopeptide (TPR) repeat protein